MKIRRFLIIGMAISLSGCRYSGYKLMSPKDRIEMIQSSMIIGYKMGQEEACKQSYDINKDPFFQGDMPNGY